MPTCTRKGCTKEFEQGSTEECIFHSGAPVFHEGLKSWSCCSDVYKPVLEFDQFLNIPGCSKAEQHTSASEPAKAPPVASPAPQTTTKAATPVSDSKGEDGKEVFSTKTLASTLPRPSVPSKPVPDTEEEDDLQAEVPSGTKCRRNGCKTVFESNEENRIGDGSGTVCLYHPREPIFHEGSKGYLCCKRRVLEFEEFLKIEGCKKGRHLFTPKQRKEQVAQPVSCRIDHYQTADQVHVSIFAKKVDKEQSIVQFDQDKVSVDLVLPNSQHFAKTIELWGPIQTSTSSTTFFGTKVELILQKADRRSWAALEKNANVNPNLSFTFGVTGRTGTIGGKEIVLDDNNLLRS